MQSTNSKYGLLYQATCHVTFTFTNIYIFNLTENGRSSQALCLMGYLGIFRYSQINMVVRTSLLYVHAVRRAVCGLAKLDLDLCTQAVWLLTLLSVCISHFDCEKYRLIVSSQCFPVWAIALDQHELLCFRFNPSQLKPNEPDRPQHEQKNYRN